MVLKSCCIPRSKSFTESEIHLKLKTTTNHVCIIFRCIIENDPNVANMSDDVLVSALTYRNDNLASFLIESRSQKAR